MDIISLLITIAGILIILALYILGQISRNKMPQEKDIASVPRIVDDNGDIFTSILDDIPATDGSTPKVKPAVQKTEHATNTTSTAQTTTTATTKPKKSTASSKLQTQHILFISAINNKGLNGNQIEKVLTQHGLHFGEMDIYHFLVKDQSNNNTGLFRIANGVDPWTLTTQDLKDKWIPGLSLMLTTPSPIDDKKAITTFIRTSKSIANKLNGELKNKQQQLFTQEDENNFLKSA